jgi:hypothetical protein
MNHREIGWGDVDWIRLAQDRDRWRAAVVLSAVMKLQVLAPRSYLVRRISYFQNFLFLNIQ